MKIRHSAKFYEDWIYRQHLTNIDMAWYIRRYTGQAVKSYKVIEFLVDKQYTADELRYMTSIR